jgi:hypothetical protein
LVFTACDSTTTNKNDTANNKFDETATVQGTVFDATTGARIGDDTLEVTLVQGTDYRSPKVLKTDSTKPFLGDFAFDNVPVTLAAQDCDGDYAGDCSGSATYRIVASMTGYEPFEGYITLSTDMYDNENTMGYSGQNNDIPTMNTVYNYVGNIYLFPLGSTAPDYTFYVEYDGERVPNATVYFEFKPQEDDGVTNQTHRICPEEALGRTLIGTTDANGVVTFTGDDLVLGGYYKLMVMPVVYEGVQLGLWDSAYFWIGWDNNEYLVNMYDLVPGNNSDGLKIISASNRDSNHVVATGVLTLSFNQVVTLVDETLCGATLFGTLDGGALDATGTPVSDSEVTVTGSGTSTLVFTPNLSTTLGVNAAEVYVVFDACYITVGDDIDDGWNAFTVPYVDGTNHNFNTVQMIP